MSEPKRDKTHHSHPHLFTFNVASTSWCVTPRPPAWLALPSAADDAAAEPAGEATTPLAAVVDTVGVSTVGLVVGLGEEGLVPRPWSAADVKTERPSLGLASRRGRAAARARGGRDGSCW